MTDAEAKRCLERIIEINDEVDGISANNRDFSAFFPLAGGLVLSIIAHIAGTLIMNAYDGGFFELFLLVIGFILKYFSLPCIAICGIGLLAVGIPFLKTSSSYGGNDKMNMRCQNLKKERKQLMDMLKASFPNAKTTPSEYNEHTRKILNKMNEGRGYMSACESVKIDNLIEKDDREYERTLERERAEKEYKQALLDEQRRANDELEAIHRQMKHDEWHRQQERSRREIEEWHRRNDPKW